MIYRDHVDTYIFLSSLLPTHPLRNKYPPQPHVLHCTQKLPCTHQQSTTLGGQVPQGDGDVDEHDEVTDEDGGHVARTLPLEFILNGALAIEGYVHVLRDLLVMSHVLHEVDEPEGWEEGKDISGKYSKLYHTKRLSPILVKLLTL